LDLRTSIWCTRRKYPETVSAVSLRSVSSGLSVNSVLRIFCRPKQHSNHLRDTALATANSEFEIQSGEIHNTEELLSLTKNSELTTNPEADL